MTKNDLGTISQGDIFQLGRHRLMCGDSTKKADISRLLDGARPEMTFADPPYGINYQSGMRESFRAFDVIEGDNEILDFLGIISEICSGFVFVCTTWRVLNTWISEFKKYFEITNMLIWWKGRGGLGDLEHTFSTDYEIILVANQGKPIKGKRCGSVWKFLPDNPSDYVHPTQKPKSLIRKAIEETTEKGDCILDPFGGSGTSLIAAEQTGRKCYMMEYSPEYAAKIIRRYELFTGQQAKKVN